MGRPTCAWLRVRGFNFFVLFVCFFQLSQSAAAGRGHDDDDELLAFIHQRTFSVNAKSAGRFFDLGRPAGRPGEAPVVFMSLRSASPMDGLLKHRLDAHRHESYPTTFGDVVNRSASLPRAEAYLESDDEDFSWLIPERHDGNQDAYKLFCPATEFTPQHAFEIPPQARLERTVFVELPPNVCDGRMVQLHELSVAAPMDDMIIQKSLRITHRERGALGRSDMTVFCVVECLRSPYCRLVVVEESSTGNVWFCHQLSTGSDELQSRDVGNSKRVLHFSRHSRALAFAFRRAVPPSLVYQGPILRLVRGPVEVVRVGDDLRCGDCIWDIALDNVDQRLKSVFHVTMAVEDLGIPARADMTSMILNSKNGSGRLIFITGGALVRRKLTFQFVDFDFGPFWGHQLRLTMRTEALGAAITAPIPELCVVVLVHAFPLEQPSFVLITKGARRNSDGHLDIAIAVNHAQEMCGAHIREGECCMTNIALRSLAAGQTSLAGMYDSSRRDEGGAVSLELHANGLPPSCTLNIVDGETTVGMYGMADFDRVVIRPSLACSAEWLGSATITITAKSTSFGTPSLVAPAHQLRSCAAPKPMKDASTHRRVNSSIGEEAAIEPARILVSTYATGSCRRCLVEHIENLLTFLPHSAGVIALLSRESYFLQHYTVTVMSDLAALKIRACRKPGRALNMSEHDVREWYDCAGIVYLYPQPRAMDRLFEPSLVALAHGLNLREFRRREPSRYFSHVLLWSSEHLLVRLGAEAYVARFDLSTVLMVPSSVNPFAQSQPPSHLHAHRWNALVDDSIAEASELSLQYGRGPAGQGLRDEFHLAAVMRKYNATRFVREPTYMTGAFLSHGLATKLETLLLDDFFLTSGKGQRRKGHVKFFEFYNIGEVIFATFFQPLCSLSGGPLRCGERLSSVAQARSDDKVLEADVQRVRCSAAELPFGLARFNDVPADVDDGRMRVLRIQRNASSLSQRREHCG